MSQHQSPQYVPQSQQANSPQQEQHQQVAPAQPTVRVMRLYKPCMHVIPTIPPTIELGVSRNADFAVSPFLLLPDSFGDIYTGELFSAYVAVVNGNQDSLFTQVTLSVRLQTTNAIHDLSDSRPVQDEISGMAKILNPSDALDVVVKHTLTELGTHTLRVSVEYSSRYFSETKTLRKFYRFNVLQPLQISSDANDIGDRILIQTLITNTTKSPLYVEEMTFSATQTDAKVEVIGAPKDSKLSTEMDTLDHFNLNSFPLLLPEEYYAVVFSISKVPGSMVQSVGSPKVKWCSYMGEHGTVVGSEVFITGANTTFIQKSSQQSQLQVNNEMVYIDCISSPSSVIRGSEFEVTLRITNNTMKDTFLQLVCKDMICPSYTTICDQLNSNTTSDSNAAIRKEGMKDTPICSSQLFVTGSSKLNIGVVKIGENVDMILTVCSVDLGLQELKGITILDMNTLREYSAKSLLKVIVVDSTE